MCEYPYSTIFDRQNIDGQHLRPPVSAILLGIIEREILMDTSQCQISQYFSIKKIAQYAT